MDDKELEEAFEKIDEELTVVKGLLWAIIILVFVVGVLVFVVGVAANAAESDSLVLSTHDNGFWYYWGDNGQFVAMQTGQDTVECPCGSDKYWISRAGVEIDPDSSRAEFTHKPPSIRVECWIMRYERRKQ